MYSQMDSSLLAQIACPRDRGLLETNGAWLECEHGHRYPVIQGVPILLVDDVSQTIGIARTSWELATGQIADDARAPGLYLPSIGISDAEKEGVIDLFHSGSPIDPVVAYLVGATNGLMYKHLIGNLASYPIPDIPVADGEGKRLLDVGCSWGRWSIAAARKGYHVVGIDPSLGAVLAAQRVARAAKVNASFLVGDARFLPFRDHTFDAVFSYSVIQHLSRSDAEITVYDIARVLAPHGESTIQMPTSFGIRCMFHQARRRFREPGGFGVRYWRLSELRRLFADAIGPTWFSPDCFFGIGLQRRDSRLMPAHLRMVIRSSEIMKTLTQRIPTLMHVADSVFVCSRRESPPVQSAFHG